MRKILLVCSVLVLMAIVFSGCGEAGVKAEDLSGIKYAGILSLSVSKTGPQTPGNDAVIQKIANYALGQVTSKLRTISQFKVYPVSAYYKQPEYQNAGTIAKASGALAYLKNNPDVISKDSSTTTETGGDFMTALKAGFKAAADAEAIRNNPVGAAQKELDDSRIGLIGVNGMPFIPYAVFNNAQPGVVSYVNGVRQGGKNEGLKQMMLEQAKTVCAKTRLDAVIVVHIETAADKPKGVYVITGGNRVLGTIRLNMTMLIINKKGEIVADLDWPSMDDLAPLKMVIPASIVTRWSSNNRAVEETVIDLNDPNGAVLNAFKELVVESSNKMVNSFRKDLGEIQ